MESLEIKRWKIIKKDNNIDHITGGPYNTQHKGAVEAFNKTTQDFLISEKGSSRENICLVDSINDLLIYYNNRRYSTSQAKTF